MISTQSLKSSFFEVGPNPDCSYATVTFPKALTKRERPERLLGFSKKLRLFFKTKEIICLFISQFVALNSFSIGSNLKKKEYPIKCFGPFWFVRALATPKLSSCYVFFFPDFGFCTPCKNTFMLFFLIPS